MQPGNRLRDLARTGPPCVGLVPVPVTSDPGYLSTGRVYGFRV